MATVHHLLLLLLLPLLAAGEPLLLTCGGAGAVALSDGRVFSPDSHTTISPPSHTHAATTSSSSSSSLYSTARVFSGEATYSLPVSPAAAHLLRLHFHASPALQSAAFAVDAGGLSLISNFSCSKMRSCSDLHYEEYILESDSKAKVLPLRFWPLPNSVAFVNAIEVIPAPAGLIPANAVPVSRRGVLETMYRINVGGVGAGSRNDSFWRVWESDQKFLINAASVHALSADPAAVRYSSAVPEYVAPDWVYSTAQEMADANVGNQRFNVSWAFRVDPGFRYSVRLHFCDIVGGNASDLVFNVYLNYQSALSSFDLSSKVGLFNAYFADFVVSVPVGSEKILVQVGPPQMANAQPNAILNGIEIMKLGDPEGSLDAIHGADVASGRPSNGHKKLAIVAALSAGGALLLVVFIVVMMLLFFRRRRKVKGRSLSWLPSSMGLHTHTGISGSKVSARSYPSSGPSLRLGQLMSFLEIRQATKNFDESLVIGVGGFGKVYKGVLGNDTMVAVKRGNPRSQQGLVEFRTEIEMLSKLRHRHLVSLIGYCHEANEMALVYEFMAGGPLRKHLYGSELPPLPWKQRLEICIGAAKGLHYLHTGASETIIHRDVKTTNILLDESLTAKVADFGLSKSAPALDQTHVSTAVKGSFGYLDPEYFRRQRLTEKSDVYSFGVVLMEVVCARPAVNPALPREQVNIVEWAMQWQKLGQLERIIDPHLVGYISIDSLSKFGETAQKCLAEYGVERPTMGDVLWNLEYALELQESFIRATGQGSSTNCIQELPDWIPQVGSAEHDSFSIASDVTDTATTRVFSQILDPRGR